MNFLTHYLSYSESNEAPTIYHKWSALSTLSHLIGPRVWTYMGGHLYFFPNMYINLVGKPGIMKSTAMKQAQELVENFKEIAISPASISKEAMVQKMASNACKRSFTHNGKTLEYSQLSIFANEFVSLLNASGNPNGMIEFLTDVWDRPGRVYDESFKQAGSNTIKRPYVTALSCLTPKTLESLVSNKVITGGMSRRTLSIVATKNAAPIPFINPSKEQVDSWLWCVEHGRRILNISGEFSWTPEARSVYIDWYEPFKNNIANEQSEVLQAFFMCKAEYVIKVSMLLAIAEPNIQLLHTEHTFMNALELVTEVEQGACALFENGGRNELIPVAEKIVQYLRGKGKATFNEVKLFVYKDLRTFELKELPSLLDYLQVTKKIEKVTETSPTFMEYYTLPKG